MKEIDEFLKKCRVFHVATVEDGQPRVRPFGAHLLMDGRLYFCTGNHKKVYAQLRENPKLEICAYCEGEWLRLSGEAVFEDNKAVKNAMLAAAPERARLFYKMPMIARRALLSAVPGLRNMVSAEGDYDEVMEVFYLRGAKAALYSLKNETKYFEW